MNNKLRRVVTTCPLCENLGERTDLSTGSTKSSRKKRSIDRYVSIFSGRLRRRCAKYARSLMRSKQLRRV